MFDIEKIYSNYLQLTSFPTDYNKYNKNLLNSLFQTYDIAQNNKQQGLDNNLNVECKIVIDLPDRIKNLIDIPVDKRIRELLKKNDKELTALTIAEEIALGKFGFFDKEKSLNLAIRTGLAILTDGVTVAPLQGIADIKIKNNDDGTSHIAIYFAGPIRSAGGTEAALTLIIADKIRQVLGIDRYHITPNEIGRMIEELRLYEREVSNFQYKVNDSDLKYTLEHIPIEIDGIQTDSAEVIHDLHRNMKRINTDRVRGGALRVLNDGVIGKSKKLLKVITDLSIPNWEWLKDINVDKNKDKIHFQDVIAGRPILSTPKVIGGLRLRYGRSINTGLSSIGIHPSLALILDYPFVVGTQVKLDLPGKGATISFVDTIEPPIVRLKDKSVIKISTLKLAQSLIHDIEQIIHLGDVLISYGDFLENNFNLPPSGYVEEWWILDLIDALKKYNIIDNKSNFLDINYNKILNIIQNPLTVIPTFDESILLCEKLNIPLHPNYLYFWDLITILEVNELRREFYIDKDNNLVLIKNNNYFKELIEKLGIPHSVKNNNIIIPNLHSKILTKLLNLNLNSYAIKKWNNSIDFISDLSNIKIKSKSSVTVGIRIGRPEKAAIRKMKPPIHVLFPINQYGGTFQDLMRARKINSNNFTINIANLYCKTCNLYSITKKCSKCSQILDITSFCNKCGKIPPTSDDKNEKKCKYCNGYIQHSHDINVNLDSLIKQAIKTVNYFPKKPLKGVKFLSSKYKYCESIEKGLLRHKHDLTIFKDGTVRFDATNSPTTHFTPKQINVTIKQLKDLGYNYDVNNVDLTSTDQLIELKIQDVILPVDCIKLLFNVSKYIDELLIHFYQNDAFYKCKNYDELIGKLIIGLAPHTSVGTIGRIIGYTDTHTCIAHPYWHSSKRRDCDGDGDAIMLLLDVLLNFSKGFLPTHSGGLMDAPLLIQPLIIPKELQRQVHNFDVNFMYPKEFYDLTLTNSSPSIIENKMDLIKNRLDNINQFHKFGFTHSTNYLIVDKTRSSYSTLLTLNDKLNKQIDLAKKIQAVDVNTVVSSVINTHLLPDILGNKTAYTTQQFRCVKCNIKYRRMPVLNQCFSCHQKLNITISQKSVEKYVNIINNLSKNYVLDNYLQERIDLINNELKFLFPQDPYKQSDLLSYAT